MNRRNFLTSLAALTATATLDPERLLWVPGKRTWFLPPSSPSQFATLTAAAYDRALREQGLRGNPWADNRVWQELERKGVVRRVSVGLLEFPLSHLVNSGR